jgi:hypothetical protein
MVTNTPMECSYLSEVTDYYTKHPVDNICMSFVCVFHIINQSGVPNAFIYTQNPSKSIARQVL